MTDSVRLNIGCGNHPIVGFVNIDLGDDADIRIDVRVGLPFADATVDAIYSEHFFEHLDKGEGLAFLRECRRVLRPGGVARLAMPDLDDLVGRYFIDDWRGDADMFKMGYDWVANRCEMLNIGMREWGHKWLYNEEELIAVADLAGFVNMRRMPHGSSAHPALAGREYRAGSKLIVEFDKPTYRCDERPLVSVAIPAYNPKFFAEALHSVLAQTYRPIEILVCDDRSDGQITDIVARARDQGAQIRLVRNPENLGGQGNLIQCYWLAAGEFVKFLNDDDVLLPNCVERLMDAFRRQPGVVMVTSHRSMIDERTQALPGGMATRRIVEEDAIIEGGSLANLVLSVGTNCIGEPSTVMFRKAALTRVKPHLASFGGRDMPGAGDVAIWLNLLSRGDAVYLTETLSCFRLHPEQRQREPEIQRRGIDTWQQLRFHAHRLGLFPARPQGVLKWRSLDGGTWRCTPLSTLFPEVAGQQRDATAPAVMDNERLYELWRHAHTLRPLEIEWLRACMRRWRQAPTFHLAVIVPEGMEADLGRTFQAFVGQIYAEGWRLTVVSTQPVPEGISGVPIIDWRTTTQADSLTPVNEALSASSADWVGMFEAGDGIAPHALFAIADHAYRHPDLCVLYTDEDSVDADGNHWGAYFKPDFNIDLCRSAPFAIGGLMLLRRGLFAELGGFRQAMEGIEYWDLLLRAHERVGADAIGHVADVLYHRYVDGGHCAQDVESVQRARREALQSHLARSGQAAVIGEGLLPGSFHVFYKHASQPLVSVIVPTKDQPRLIRRCLESLLEKTDYPNFEVLVVDNGTTDAKAVEFLATIATHPRVSVLPYVEPFNFSAMNNFAARKARGELLLLLNNDTAVLHEQWLDEMVSHALRPDVGVVGARLLYPDGRVQHAGVVLGLGGAPADHLFIGQTGEAPGYYGRAQLTQSFSAVTAACMMVRRAAYFDVGGLDESLFRVSFNDVDFCLKIRQQGWLVVWTPFATLLHEGSVSQASNVEAGAQQDKHLRFRAEAQAMYDKWPRQIAYDPAFNRNLCLHDRAGLIEIAPALTWDPEWRPRPRVLAHTADRMGCGEYRIIAPMRALNAAGHVQGWETGSYISVPELFRMSPDAIVVQRQVSPEQHALLEQYVRNSKAFRVFEIDDLITNVPIKNPRKSHFVANKELHKHFRKGVGMCHRLVVSTEYLAETYRGYTDEVVTVPNYVERAVWGDFKPLRRQGAKARVGWAGSVTHHGDLDIIIDMVKATVEEVDWVFFGMCPEALKPLIKEFHQPVKLEDYPAKLASLNLDLAVAPLEDVPFNHAKSHLRLLEYGVLGYPVICTDITPYKGAYPVTRVPNKFKDWVDAIREQVSDMDELARRGDALREHIQAHWMLEDNLDVWLKAWLPE